MSFEEDCSTVRVLQPSKNLPFSLMVIQRINDLVNSQPLYPRQFTSIETRTAIEHFFLFSCIIFHIQTWNKLITSQHLQPYKATVTVQRLPVTTRHDTRHNVTDHEWAAEVEGLLFNTIGLRRDGVEEVLRLSMKNLM